MRGRLIRHANSDLLGIESARQACDRRLMMAVTEPARLGGDPYSRRLVELVDASRFTDLDEATVHALRVFVADTLATGVAGGCNPAAAGVLAAMRRHAETGGCVVLGRPDTRLPALEAALINGFQIHSLEWDGLHERSVVIALCTTIAALMSESQTRSATLGDLLLAFAVGVEAAVFFGSAASTAPRFFRPSTAGVLGAALAVGKLRGFSRKQLLDLLGLAYSQAGGTMQAHWEGSEALALQVGFAARAALTAADLVDAGIAGPHDVVSGKFGYFALFEQPGDLPASLATWGAPWKICEVAHKPFPAGRATQATLTALLDMRAERDFAADDVIALRVHLPPLAKLLVGRPYRADMSPSYARLCLQYVASRMLLDRTIDPRKFTPDYFSARDAAALAERVQLHLDDNPDPNALGPQGISIELIGGAVLHRVIDVPLGSPAHPLTARQRIDKIARCFAAAGLATDPVAFMTACETLPLTAPAAAVLATLHGEL